MADIVSLEEAKEHIRVRSHDEDALIALYISAASDAVRDLATGWDGEEPAPARLKLAVLTRVSVMFENRESVEAASGEDRLILPLRDLQL